MRQLDAQRQDRCLKRGRWSREVGVAWTEVRRRETAHSLDGNRLEAELRSAILPD